MNGAASPLRSSPTSQTQTETLKKRNGFSQSNGPVTLKPKPQEDRDFPSPPCVSDAPPMRKNLVSSEFEFSNGPGDHTNTKSKNGSAPWSEKAYFMKWRLEDVWGLLRYHPVPCFFAACVLFFMGVEYTLRMIPFSSPPFDLGFVVTVPLNRLLASRPFLNNFLAGLNTVFVGMQTAYIVGTFVLEGRPRATIAAVFMFTCRGILGYVTQLPLPQDFLGSGVDFPVGNVSFFLFYSGHVAASVIASLDMKRMQRWEWSWTFDALNFLQVVRLLGTRGHYTIDLAVGVGAGMLFDSLAGKYLEKEEKGIRRS